MFHNVGDLVLLCDCYITWTLQNAWHIWERVKHLWMKKNTWLDGLSAWHCSYQPVKYNTFEDMDFWCHTHPYSDMVRTTKMEKKRFWNLRIGPSPLALWAISFAEILFQWEDWIILRVKVISSQKNSNARKHNEADIKKSDNIWQVLRRQPIFITKLYEFVRFQNVRDIKIKR